jgi:cytochrome P450
MARRPVVEFDHFAHRSLSESDEAWRDLRERCPVAWTEANGGHWIVTRYDEVATAFRDWETFSSARNHPSRSSLTIGEPPMPLLVPEELDPPAWHPYRRILAELLSPKAVQRMRPRVVHWVTHHVDRIVAAGAGDLAHDLAVPVPAHVTMEWLGWPQDEWMEAAAVFHDMARHPWESPAFAEAGLKFGWLAGRIREEVTERRERPRDDVMSTIAHHDVDGEVISVDDACAMVLLAIGGGVDTTTSLTSAALVHLGRHPDDRRRLLEDRSLLPAATEEFLRVYPPARTHARTVARDTVLGGCPMQAGDRVLLSEVSACHDEREFPDADRFVLDRSPNRHVAFGMGIHRCPGSHLARLEFTEMLTQVLDRMPGYVLDEEGTVEYPNWSAIGGWGRIPVRVTP